VRNIRTSVVEFDSGSKIRETDEAVIVPAVLARECVSDYCNGRGYKPSAELKAAAFTLDGAWVVVYDHIPTTYVQDCSDIRGRIRDVAFNEKINAVVGDVWFLKAHCDQALLDKVRKGELAKDVSAAYFADEVFEPGKFGDDAYDFVQKNIMFGHVAVGVPEGRCPSPFCGLQMDRFDGFLRVNVRDPKLFACRLSTLAVDAKEGIYALVGKLKKNLLPSGYADGDAVARDFLFEASNGWTPEKAEAYVKEHADLAIPGVATPNEKPPEEIEAKVAAKVGQGIDSVEDTTSILSTPALDPRGNADEVLDPLIVLACSRRLLGNVPKGRTNVMTSAGWGARHHDGA
jgi:hypothetical protein